MGPYQPTLIIHGGAGNITRSSLPPDLYAKYHASLLKYLTSTRDLLHNGADAVEAACHAVSMLEDDPLFNCGRGSVFTIDGEIEMEASLMISSVDDFSISNTPSDRPDRSNHTKGKKLAGRLKKNAAVSMIKQTRHPILLAREVLVMADEDEAGRPSTLPVSELDAPDGQYCGDGLKEHSETRSNMHGHLSGPWIEEWGFRRGLERKGREWFWTKKRWEEHRRGLHLDATDQAWHEKLDQHQKESTEENEDDDCYPDLPDEDQNIPAGVHEVPSQGTVGAVCMDSWGNICVATSTGGLTNKRTGRIGDTPTVGAGFWAESWSEELASSAYTPTPSVTSSIAISVRHAIRQGADFWIGDCFPGRLSQSPHLGAFKSASPRDEEICAEQPRRFDLTMTTANPRSMRLASTQQRAVALSGTGNGDSFLRINAARTAAAIARFSTKSLSQELNISLQDSVTAIAGPGGELQKSADSRWGKTGEGEGGIIAIEATKRSTGTSLGQFTANVVFDFNCAGMWRAYYEDQPNGELEPRVMVFKTEYAA